MKIDLEGRVTIVTGASRGIGRAIARAFAECGARVALNYVRDEDAATAAAADVEAASGHALLCKGSVADAAFVDRMVTEVTETWGQIDCLVNNAGITRDMFLGMMSEERWDEVIETNLKSVYLCSKRVIKPMIARRTGNIINLSSKSAESGRAGQVNYASSKGAILAFTRSLAREVGQYDVRVNAIVAGLIETDMTHRLPRKVHDAVIDNLPLGRKGTPAEVAALAAFLASDLASYMTGSCVDISGGL